MDVVKQALASYGATIGEIGATIIRNGKTTGVAVHIRANRVRFVSTGSGKLLASGPVKVESVENFVESFWFWEKS